MTNEQTPRTARDALLIELLGDLGVVHDEIKSLPNNLKDSLRESLTMIANAVEEAENTAKKITAETRMTLEADKNAVTEAMSADIAQQIKVTLQNELGNELNKCAETVANIRDTLSRFPDSFRAKFPVWPFAIMGVLIAGMAFGMFRMYQQNDELHRNVGRVYVIYEQQQKVIATLPPEIRKKFSPN
mgnify:CR=1 FL=1